MVNIPDPVLSVLDRARYYVAVVSPYFRTFGRTATLLTAGLVITFIQNHANIVGLVWLEIITVVSLAVRDDRSTLVTKALWWVNVLFAGATLLGLLIGRLGPASALSLCIALVLFEGARGFVRKDILFGWGSVALFVGLTIMVPLTREDSTMVAGSIGAWAAILGVFGAIRQSEALILTGKQAIRRVTKR